MNGRIRIMAPVIAASVLAAACGGPTAEREVAAGPQFGSCGVPMEGTFRVGPVRSEYVTMRDGVRIALDVILPDSVPAEGVPTVLVMTRYWRATEGQAPTTMQKFW